MCRSPSIHGAGTWVRNSIAQCWTWNSNFLYADTLPTITVSPTWLEFIQIKLDILYDFYDFFRHNKSGSEGLDFISAASSADRPISIEWWAFSHVSIEDRQTIPNPFKFSLNLLISEKCRKEPSRCAQEPSPGGRFLWQPQMLAVVVWSGRVGSISSLLSHLEFFICIWMYINDC